jgi:hypothetical protein
MQLVILGSYFAVLFAGIMVWSKFRHRKERELRDSARPILRKIEEHSEETHHEAHIAVGR